jgi:hypothetical protein
MYFDIGSWNGWFYFHVNLGNLWPSMGKPSQSNFFQMSMFMCFINLYHVQNILYNGHIIVSQIFCELLLHFEMLVLENLEKSDF